MLEYHMSYDYKLMYNIEILVRNVVKKCFTLLMTKFNVALDIFEQIIFFKRDGDQTPIYRGLRLVVTLITRCHHQLGG